MITNYCVNRGSVQRFRGRIGFSAFFMSVIERFAPDGEICHVINRRGDYRQLFSNDDEYVRVVGSCILQRGAKQVILVVAFDTKGKMVSDGWKGRREGIVSNRTIGEFGEVLQEGVDRAG